MKRIISIALSLLAAVALLGGCGGQDATIDGTWQSVDGSTLTIADGMLTLTDSMGQSILADENLPCEHRGDFLYVEIGGVEVKVFEADLDGDKLTLNYTVDIQSDMQTTVSEPIELTRSQD